MYFLSQFIFSQTLRMGTIKINNNYKRKINIRNKRKLKEIPSSLSTFFKRIAVQEEITDRCTGGFWTFPYPTISTRLACPAALCVCVCGGGGGKTAIISTIYNNYRLAVYGRNPSECRRAMWLADSLCCGMGGNCNFTPGSLWNCVRSILGTTEHLASQPCLRANCVCLA